MNRSRILEPLLAVTVGVLSGYYIFASPLKEIIKDRAGGDAKSPEAQAQGAAQGSPADELRNRGRARQ